MNYKLIITLITICTATSVFAQRRRPPDTVTPYWVQKTKRASSKMYAKRIKCDLKGNLVLSMGNDGGITSKMPQGSYYRVGTPKNTGKLDRAVKAAFKANTGAAWDLVIKEANTFLKRYAWLGWGGYVAYIKGKAQMAKKDIKGATQTFKVAIDYAKIGKPIYYFKIKRGSIEVDLASENWKAADRKLRGIGRGRSNLPFIYVSKGKILEGNGKSKEAMFEYLKVATVFKNDRGARMEVKEAMSRLIPLLKNLKDNRYKFFAAELKAM